MAGDLGYVTEEYGLFEGKPITRAEFDDGATVQKGKVVPLRGKAELRVRYLTPYNFVIASHASPLNTPSFDDHLQTILNAMLRESERIEILVEAIKRLPAQHLLE